jgi:diphthamide biosynthesis methyltransferase
MLSKHVPVVGNGSWASCTDSGVNACKSCNDVYSRVASSSMLGVIYMRVWQCGRNKVEIEERNGMEFNGAGSIYVH